LNIYLQEFKMRLMSVAVWSAAVVALLLVFVSIYSSFAAQAASVSEMIAKFPPQLLQAFGINSSDFATVPGYFGFVFLFVQLCLAIQAANYGFSMVSVEEREWTADFLLTRPVNRPRVLTAKFLAALTGLTVTNIVVWVATFGFLAVFASGGTYSLTPLVLLLLSIIVFQLFFLSVGLVVSLTVKRIRSVTPYAMGLGFGMYALSVFGDMMGTSILEDITPFKHFDPGYILQNIGYDLPLALISVAVILVSIACSYILYIKRDIPAVS
jgi:ABC-2 type transport system permease protein